MLRSSRIARYVLALASCVSVLLLVGCSEHSPLSSQPDENPYLISPEFVTVVNPPQPTQGLNQPLPPIELASQVIRNETGGEVSGGRYLLQVPAGAMPVEEAVFTISEVSPDMVMCDIEPHGIQFLVPVRIIIDCDGTTAEGQVMETRLVYFNEEMGWWELIPGGPWPEDPDKFCGFLDHFSRYALAN
jgi:hypothetical protein